MSYEDVLANIHALDIVLIVSSPRRMAYEDFLTNIHALDIVHLSAATFARIGSPTVRLRWKHEQLHGNCCKYSN